MTTPLKPGTRCECDEWHKIGDALATDHAKGKCSRLAVRMVTVRAEKATDAALGSDGCTCEGIHPSLGCEREGCDCSVHHREFGVPFCAPCATYWEAKHANP